MEGFLAKVNSPSPNRIEALDVSEKKYNSAKTIIFLRKKTHNSSPGKGDMFCT